MVTVELVGVAVAVVLVVARVVVVVVVVVLVVAVALSRQKETSCRTLLARERKRAPDYLLFVFRRRNRSLRSRRKDGVPQTFKNKSLGPPPLPSLQNREDEYSTSCSYCSGLERLSAPLPSQTVFPGDDALGKPINREECPHHPFKALML